ncbi:hypothetical protein SHELI_v1c04160 [Spiroplasma helicoides]|uniref:Lipoprotein n=1 Tax=Spiroplasma helicoides TaxID=216938 RepID=A0A1B3SKB1_9MOLU|nr:lipoprotein [Spiroplasma helicoides]AOG60367.1 hypothetical protein SHELI_v1c04160 [Spiroplasma helicoides]
MKKLLIILSSFSLSAQTSFLIVSCSDWQNKTSLTVNDVMSIFLKGVPTSLSRTSFESIVSSAEGAFMHWNNEIFLKYYDVFDHKGFYCNLEDVSTNKSYIKVKITISEINKIQGQFKVDPNGQVISDAIEYKIYQQDKILVDKEDIYVQGDETVKLFISNSNMFSNLFTEWVNDATKDAYDGFYWENKEKGILCLKFKSFANAEDKAWSDLILWSENLERTTIRVHIKPLDKDFLSVSDKYINTNWAKQFSFQINNYNFYKNVKIEILDKKYNFLGGLSVEQNTGIVSAYAWFSNETLNDFYSPRTDVILSISADGIKKATRVLIRINQIKVFDNKNIDNTNYLKVGEESNIQLDKSIKNLKLSSEKSINKNNIIFKNGVATENSIDYTNEKAVNVEGWIYNSDESNYTFDLTGDYTFDFKNNGKFTKKITLKATFVIESFKFDPKRTVDQNWFDVSSNLDDKLSWKWVNKGYVKTLQINTNKENITLKTNTNFIRYSNSWIRFKTNNEDNLQNDLSYDKPSVISEYTNINFSYDLQQFKDKKNVKFSVQSPNFTIFYISINYRS